MRVTSNDRPDARPTVTVDRSAPPADLGPLLALLRRLAGGTSPPAAPRPAECAGCELKRIDT